MKETGNYKEKKGAALSDDSPKPGIGQMSNHPFRKQSTLTPMRPNEFQPTVFATPVSVNKDGMVACTEEYKDGYRYLYIHKS